MTISNLARPAATSLIESPIGPIAASVDGDGRLIRVEYADARGDVVSKAVDSVADAFAAYFGGELEALDDVATAAAGTTFQQRVWAVLRAIPVGETTSYADVAAEVGAPRAVRAVGRANAANPIGIVVPCHRVVRSDGSLGGYGGGPDRKRWLLRHEGAIDPELADAGC